MSINTVVVDLLSTAFRRRRRRFVRSGVPPSLRVSFYHHSRRRGRKICERRTRQVTQGHSKLYRRLRRVY